MGEQALLDTFSFDGLSSKAIFERAGQIASERYPHGCSSATILGDIVREAIADLRLRGLLSRMGEIDAAPQ